MKTTIRNIALIAFAHSVLVTGCKKGNTSTTEEFDTLPWPVCVMTYEARGEKHEYLYIAGNGPGITHLPNCKYCQENRKGNITNEQ